MKFAFFFGSFRNPWNLPFRKFLQLNSFATNEICLLGSFSNSFHFATFCHILQRYCNFCSDTFNLCNVTATFLICCNFLTLQLLAKCFKFANFIHCIYYAKVLPCNLLHGFNLRDTVVFIITEFFLKSITFKSTVVLIITESPVH